MSRASQLLINIVNVNVYFIDLIHCINAKYITGI